MVCGNFSVELVVIREIEKFLMLSFRVTLRVLQSQFIYNVLTSASRGDRWRRASSNFSFSPRTSVVKFNQCCVIFIEMNRSLRTLSAKEWKFIWVYTKRGGFHYALYTRVMLCTEDNWRWWCWWKYASERYELRDETTQCAREINVRWQKSFSYLDQSFEGSLEHRIGSEALSKANEAFSEASGKCLSNSVLRCYYRLDDSCPRAGIDWNEHTPQISFSLI